MHMNDYQAAASRTAGTYINPMEQLVNGALGLSGESGEVADHVKKVLFQGHKLDRAEVAKELGDILWYVALSAGAIGLDLETVAMQNILKLERRYPQGFSKEASLNRNQT